MEKNLEIYENHRTVPKEAQKIIGGGRLKGKTDINPMWRIKALTEQFGPCGIGWKPVIKRFWLESGFNNEQSAFCEIELFIKVDGKWSDAIPGIGGSAFVAKEQSGLYTSDECYKMAYTDAISVACKALGFGADVYWEADATKYTNIKDIEPKQPTKTITKSKQQQVIEAMQGTNFTNEDVVAWIKAKTGANKKVNELDDQIFTELIKSLKNPKKKPETNTETTKQEELPFDE